MSLTSFTLFEELVPELRNRIWQFTIASHVQDVSSKFQPWYNSAWAERRRQAIVGGSPGKERPFLFIHIRDPYDGRKLRFEEDEFESLVDSFPLSAICRETRVNVADYCRFMAHHIQLGYDTSKLWSLTPPDRGAQAIVLRNVHCLPKTEKLEHLCPQPVILTVNAGLFKSSAHLVATILQFFGNRVQRLVMNLVLAEGYPIKKAYWKGTGKMPISIEVTSRDSPSLDPAIIDVAKDPELDETDSFRDMVHGNHNAPQGCSCEADPETIYATQDHKLHVSSSFWHHESYSRDEMSQHLLKLYDIFDASREKLPRLEHIEVNLEVWGMSGTDRTHLATRWKRIQ